MPPNENTVVETGETEEPSMRNAIYPAPRLVTLEEARSAVTEAPPAAVVGVKFDHGKPRLDLLPHAAVLAMARVLTFGAKKYAPDNWKIVPGGTWRYYRAALGHLFKWWLNQAVHRDEESGESHLAHAMCCIAFLLDHEENGMRFPPDENGDR